MVDLPELRIALERVSSNQEPVEDFEIEQAFPIGKLNLLMSARSIQTGSENQILVAVEDVTAQKRAEHVLIDEQERLKHSLESGETALHESEAALFRGRNELRVLTAKLMQTRRKSAGASQGVA